MISRGDLLLKWVSCFHELRVARVQAAAERLCAPPVPMSRDDRRIAPYRRSAQRLLRNLVRLGHLEELTAERFRTVPPTIVASEGERHFLTGARSDGLLKSLASFPGVSVLPAASQLDGPATCRVVGTAEAVVAAASELQIKVARERGRDLLASLPRLADTLTGAPSEGIPDNSERWDPDTPTRRSRWSRIKIDGHAPGLYRSIRKPHTWYIRAADGAQTTRLNTTERRVAAAWFLRRGKVRVEYASKVRELAVPAIGLPSLVDRGLILASGRLPEWRSHSWIYFDIDPDRARQLARIVGAPIEMTT